MFINKKKIHKKIFLLLLQWSTNIIVGILNNEFTPWTQSYQHEIPEKYISFGNQKFCLV